LNGRVTPLATQVQELPDNRVRLEVEVPSDDVHHAVEHAASDLAGSLRIPGFRKGKVPMPVLLARVGRERLYSEAVESHIGTWFWNAASRSRIRPVEQPSYDYELPGSDRDAWRFTATVAVQPKVEAPDWTKLEVPYIEPEVPAQALDAELGQLRSSVAELVPVENRAVAEGDTVVIDLVTPGGETQSDYVVELGQGRLLDELEAGIVGMQAGETKQVEAELMDGSTTSIEVTVKEIKEKVLPPLDDDLARAASEFETLDALRGEIESRLREQVEAETESAFRAATADALVEAANVSPDGPLVESRSRELLTGFLRSLDRRGISAETYLQLTGTSAQELQERMREEARRSVARELVLEAAAEKLGLEVDDAEVETLVREQAAAEGEEDVEGTLEALRAAGRFDQLRDDLRLRNALDRVVAEVKRIPAELAAAREKLWTPEQEKTPTDTKLWTPGSKERA
jgi:trigger factor